jgi:1-acyl-sn-glycerol-3-phosphate acyltransferase
MVYKNTPMKNTKKAYTHAIVIFIYFAILIIVHMIVARIFRSKKLVEYVHRKYIYGLSKNILKALSVEVAIEGTWPNDKSVHMIMSNHVSWLDIFVIGYALKGRSVTAVSKLSNFLIPFFGLGMYMLFVRPMRRNRKDPKGDRKRIGKVFETCTRYNLDLLFFPEGTRTTDGSLGNFKNGGFELSFVEKTPDVIAEEEKVNFDNETKIGGLFYDNLDSNAKEEFIKNKSRQNRDAFASQAEFIENYEKTRNRMKEVIDRNGDKEELLLVWGIHPSYLDSIKDKPEEIENSYKKALEEYGLNR